MYSIYIKFNWYKYPTCRGATQVNIEGGSLNNSFCWRCEQNIFGLGGIKFVIPCDGEDELVTQKVNYKKNMVFLSGAECPFTCSFCDLWRWTFEGPTPAGAIPRQLREVLHTHAGDATAPQRLKLYNASNFFDRRAVPAEDVPTIAALAEPLDRKSVV